MIANLVNIFNRKERRLETLGEKVVHQPRIVFDERIFLSPGRVPNSPIVIKSVSPDFERRMFGKREKFPSIQKTRVRYQRIKSGTSDDSILQNLGGFDDAETNSLQFLAFIKKPPFEIKSIDVKGGWAAIFAFLMRDNEELPCICAIRWEDEKNCHLGIRDIGSGTFRSGTILFRNVS